MFVRLLTALLGFVLATPVHVAEGQECFGAVVSQVVIDGCGKGQCSDSSVQKRLVSLTDLEGSVFADTALQLATQRLEKTGYFRSVTGSCAIDAVVGATVTFRVVPNRYLRKVDVEGTKALYKSELKKRLFLRTGTVFNPNDKETDDRVERQKSSLETYVKQQGFNGAKVTHKTTMVEPDLVDLVFYVEEGKVTRIENIEVNIAQTPAPEDHPEYGCPTVSKKQIERIIGVSTGDLYSANVRSKAKKESRFFLQKYGFQAPKIDIDFFPESETLNINITLDKCFSIQVFERENWQPYGGGYLKSDDLSVFYALPFRESGVFERGEAERGLQELLVYYQVRGYLFAQVEMQYIDYREKGPGWKYPLLGGVVYRVTLGSSSEVRSLTFRGVKAISQAELEAVMQTRRYDFFDIGGFLQVEQLFADLDMIRALYLERGFFQMNFPDATGDQQIRVEKFAAGDRMIWKYRWRDKAFDVVKPGWESPIRVIVRIDEGPGSVVSTIQLAGVQFFDQSELLQGLPTTKGGPFSPSLVRKTVAGIDKRYRQQGFVPRITVSCIGYNPDVPKEQCDINKVSSSKVDLFLDIVEGPRSLMGEVLVVGNLRTKAAVVRRDFPSEGEPVDWNKVEEAIRRLRNSGIFASVRVSPIGDQEPVPRSKVAMAVQVEETTTEFIDIALGFQTITRAEEQINMAPLARDLLSTSLHYTGASLSGSATFQTIALPDVLLLASFSYYDHNFIGRQKDLILPVQYGLSTTDPVRYISFMPTYYDRRFFSTDVSLRVTPLIVFDKALKLLDTFEYGGEIELSYVFVDGLYISWLNRLSRIQWKEPSDDEFGDMEFQIKSTPQIRYDWRDSPINPTAGGMVTGRVSYLNALNQEAVRDNFWKYELGGQYYLSFRKLMVLGINFRIGSSSTPSGGNLPENERFRLGGANGMRGFAYGGIGQYEADGDLRLLQGIDSDGQPLFSPITGGDTVLNGSIELRFPILRRTELWGAVFTDWGALTDEWSNLSGNSFRFSVGAGIRLLIGGQIPLRLDYGFVLDRRCSEVEATTGKCSAREETGALDFGLLYTF